MRLKSIRRSSAVFIAIMLAAAVTLGAAAATVLNSTVAENAATPKYYSAVKDWSLENNTADSQNVFSYEFALDGNNPLWNYMSFVHPSWDEWYTGSTDYTDFNNLSEEEWSSKYSADSFKFASGISPKGRMRIWNRYGDLSLLDSIPAAALTYTAKADGFISISSHSATLFRTYFTKDKGYKALLRITKNGENFYPESGYLIIDDTITSVNFPTLDVTVNEGDKLRFELTSDTAIASGESIGINWNPVFYVTAEKEHYTATEDVFNNLTHFMNEFFRGKQSETMTFTDSITLANEVSRKSKYGVYTAMDTLYSDGIIPSDDDTVWKYAVSSVPYGFKSPSADYGLSLENTDDSTVISWNSKNAQGLKSVLVGIDDKQYTYMSPDGDASINLPLCSGNITVQLEGEKGTSEILKISDGLENVINTDDIVYLDSAVKSGSGANAVYILSDESVNSSYTLRYSFDTFKSASTASNGRSITFNNNANEQMMFGFTAPMGGTYEISAPIEVENNKNAFYSILKEDINGTITVVDGIRNYNNDKSGYATLLSLNSGETVWLSASSSTDAKICIGVPRVTLKEETKVYKYRAIDYVESDSFNNKEYNNICLSEKAGAVWEFGYFENPIDGDNKDALGYMDYAVGEDVSSLQAVFKPYELLRGGKWYNPLVMVTKSDGTISGTYSYGGAGILHATMATAYSSDKSHQNIGLPYQNKGFMVTVGSGTGKDGNSHNMGIYMKFTAPKSGYITLNLNALAQVNSGCRVLLIKGSQVISVYNSVPMDTVADLGFMSKGESVYICYGTDSSKLFYNYGGSPVANISGDRVNVKIGEGSEYSLAVGEKITLPDNSNVIGKALLGWINGFGKEYYIAEKYSVQQNDRLEEINRYYGDFTGDGNINATDMAAMRESILERDEYILSVSDVNSDGEFNAADLVRIKKWLAGNTVAFNTK